MKFNKHTVTIWRESLVKNILVPYIAFNPTFENYIEASQGARVLSMAIGVIKTEVHHVDTEKTVEEWKCGCVEYLD